MNPSELMQMDVLFDGCPQAGGWSRVGWQAHGPDEDTLTCFEGYTG